MANDNTVYPLEDGEAVTGYHCLRAGNDRRYRKGEAFLAGAGHSPCDANANYICRQHLDPDAVIWPPESQPPL